MIYKELTKSLTLNNVQIQYTLLYKKIKNINLRIKKDGTVYVSAPRVVSEDNIEKFLISKWEFILKAVGNCSKINNKPLIKYFDETEVKEVIISLCKKIYPYFEEKGIRFPEIRFRKMTSRWGSCIPSKHVLTFNTNLMYAPIECIDYVVKHEFTHFLQPNHQKAFYAELSKICPNWKDYKNILKSINIE